MFTINIPGSYSFRTGSRFPSFVEGRLVFGFSFLVSRPLFPITALPLVTAFLRSYDEASTRGCYKHRRDDALSYS